MATLLFTSASSALIGSGAVSGFAGTLLTAGAKVLGNSIDNALFGKKTYRKVEGPRMNSLNVLSATEGSPIIQAFGRVRISGEIIWSTRLREEIITTTETVSGGKGGGRTSSQTVETTEYKYYANFAVGLCEGEAAYLNRVWADGKELNLSDYTYRFYKGTETQLPDSLMVSKEGNAPAYRGVSYVVFEDMPLARFGNRIPQLQFEIIKPVKGAQPENIISGVNMIPGSTEFGYDPLVVEQTYGSTVFNNLQVSPENNYLKLPVSDFQASLDHLEFTCPNLKTVCLVVAWFGDDLRAGNCTIRPKVENDTKITNITWQVGALTRSTATLVSSTNGRPSFGGTPNDTSVMRAIAAIKAKGWKVMFYPFILMDIQGSNNLPNPYSDNAATLGQAAFPWRGRITLSPALGYAGEAHGTVSADAQISNFLNGTWGYENFIRHYKDICVSAGGVDYFCVGSEMVEMTKAANSAGIFAFSTALADLALEVKSALPSSKVGYAADWSEYGKQTIQGDRKYPCDIIWSSPNIDFIGIDNYLPLSDWRDTSGHLDEALAKSIYDIDYLKGNIEGGEYYDWHYVDKTARDNQVRTLITNPVDRTKDIRTFWMTQHFEEVNGTQNVLPTSYIPEAKPVIFTEIGCPAIDKGSNQPNVFSDGKSSESNIPYYSTGSRDDNIQRQFIKSNLEYWNNNNQASTVYAGDMIDLDASCIWAWDARPSPTFPYNSQVYVDGKNWATGHWISNRMGRVEIVALLNELSEIYGISQFVDFENIYGNFDGFIIDRIMSFREMTSPLELMFFFEFHEVNGFLVAVSKIDVSEITVLSLDDIAVEGTEEPVLLTRGQIIDLPSKAKLSYISADANYKSSVVEAQRLTVQSIRVSQAALPVVIDMVSAKQIIDRWLYSIWSELESASFSIMPSLALIQPGSIVTVPIGGNTKEFRVSSLLYGLEERKAKAISFDQSAYTGSTAPERDLEIPVFLESSGAATLIMDLPMIADSDSEIAPYAAASTSPWPGVNIFRSPTDASYEINTILTGPSIIGSLRFDLYSGPLARWDEVNDLYVEIISGQLSSKEKLLILGRSNLVGVKSPSGEWEILQFREAVLEGTNQYKLSGLLRGQRGSEEGMANPVPSGSEFVFFNLAVKQIDFENEDIQNSLYYKTGPSNKEINSSTYETTIRTFNGRGRKPYSPSHLKMTWPSNPLKDVKISWKRRTRIFGDSWSYTSDVPLSEQSEIYEVDIYSNGQVIRTINSVVQDLIYTSVDQITDFGAVQNSLDVEVYQFSTTYGRGTGRRETLFPE